MIEFRDPGTLAITAVALSTAGLATSGIQSLQQGAAGAADLKAQRELEATAARREIRDEVEQNRRSLARTRALLSAGGAGTDVIAGVLGAQGAESLIRQHRIRTGAATTRSLLTARASNVRQAGRIGAAGQFAQAGSTAAGGGAKLLRRGNFGGRTSIDPTTLLP